jgi:hypothetical protein
VTNPSLFLKRIKGMDSFKHYRFTVIWNKTKNNTREEAFSTENSSHNQINIFEFQRIDQQIERV